MKLPLPVPDPPSAMLPSVMESSSTSLSATLPVLAVPVLAVTVQVVPLPVTLDTLAPVAPPVRVKPKSLGSTPVTLVLKTTDQVTDLLLELGL